MAQDPTIGQVCERTRWHLGDTQVPNGETYTNTLLLPWVKAAIEDMQRGLGLVDAIRQRRIGFIPIMGGEISQITPRTWLPDCDRVVEIYHRPLISRTQITGAVISGNTMNITCGASHGRVSNDQVEVTGLLPNASAARGMNSTFRAIVTGANTLTVLGEFSAGLVTAGANSWLLWGGLEAWHPMKGKDDLINPQSIPGTPQWGEQGGAIWLAPPGTQIMLRLVYEYTDDTQYMDANTVVGYPGSLGFLSLWSAYMAGRSKGAQGEFLESLRRDAIGSPAGGIVPTVERPTGGALHALVVAETKRQQMKPRTRPPYRNYRRPIGPLGYNSY